MLTWVAVCTWIPLLCTSLAELPDIVEVGNTERHRYELRASTFTPSAQAETAVAAAPDGTLIAVWSSRRQNEGRYGVYAQRFTAEGVALGGETALAAGATHHTSPDITFSSAGVGWAVWQSHGRDGHAGSIIARRIDAELSAGDEILVNQKWRGHQIDPVVAVWPNGDALIVWTSVERVKDAPQVRARRFGRDGTPLGDEFAVRDATASGALTPAAAICPDGSFLIVYSKLDGERKPAGIGGRRFARDGAPLGDELNISGPRRASQIEPAIAAGGNRFLVAWLDAESDGDDYGVLARLLDHDGEPVGDPFIVNTSRRGPQNAAAVAASDDGGFAIAWNSRHDGVPGVYVQHLYPCGGKRGAELRLTRHTEGPQSLRIAAATNRLLLTPENVLVAAWSGDGDRGDASAAHLTILSPHSLGGPEIARGVTKSMQPAGPSADAATPHQPPTFDPRDIDLSEREIGDITRADFGFDAILNTGWTPPDPILAVGPDHLVAMTNGAIAFFTKDGTLTFQEPIEGSFGFWGGLGATGFVFDPEVLYDEGSGRFFAMAAEAFAPGSRSYVLIAVSDDSNPNGTWHKYRFETTALAGNLFDSPNIGVDETAVYVTGDGFGIASNYPVYIYDKASLLAGNPPAVTKSFTIATNTQSAGIPPFAYGASAFPLIEHREGMNQNAVRLLAINDPLGTPTVSQFTLNVPAYDHPEDPPQLGTSTRPETFDQRFWSVSYRGDRLWATHHVNSSRVRSRWYEIALNGWPASGTPTLVQSGEIDGGGTVRTFFGSISVNDQGTAAICVARSSPTEFISMATTYRLACDPPGTFRPMTIQRTSTAGDSSGRWGDYSDIQPDPAVPNRFWAIHEYTTGSWRTWISRIDTEVCSIPGDINGDGQVDLADLSLLLESFGLCDGDAGYNADADLDNDGCVGLADLTILLENYGT